MPDLAAVRSPCTGVCQVKNQSCVGCGRTRDQIARWTSMSDSERDGLMRALGAYCRVCRRVLPVTGDQTSAICPECGKT